MQKIKKNYARIEKQGRGGKGRDGREKNDLPLFINTKKSDTRMQRIENNPSFVIDQPINQPTNK